MRYLQSFNTANNVQTALDNDSLGKPYVAYIIQEDRIDWNGLEPSDDPSKEYLTFEILSDGTINWTAVNTALTRTIEYKLNNGVWTSITSNTGASAPTINVVAGDEIQFRGNNETYASDVSHYNTFKDSTAKFNVEGNIMSLIESDGFVTETTLASSYTFCYLFRNCTGLTSAENLMLPATTLASYCYSNMFEGCTSLTTAPVLPATTLATGCYASMFSGCMALTSAPELPATTLANNCYQRMFFSCTSLTTAPVLPATTLASYCYQTMFSGCRALNYIKCLATNISASNCTSTWVYNLSSTGTFVKNPNMTGWTTGTSGIPTGWTVIDA